MAATSAVSVFTIAVFIIFQLWTIHAKNQESRIGKVFVPAISQGQTTTTIVRVSTSVVFPSCFVGPVANAGAACSAGKRKKRNLNIGPNIGSSEVTIESSRVEDKAIQEDSLIDSKGRILRFTIWTTTTVTTTVTVLSTNLASRVSISFLCIAAGQVIPLAC